MSKNVNVICDLKCQLVYYKTTTRYAALQVCAAYLNPLMGKHIYSATHIE